MDIQKHRRTHQIKKLSTVLYTVLSILQALFYCAWPAIIAVALFFDEGEIQLGNSILYLEHISWSVKMLVMTLFSAGAYLAIRIVGSFKKLMYHFKQGDIFKPQAIAHVHSALISGGLFFLLALVQEGFGWFLAKAHNAVFTISLWSECFFMIIFVALMYTLLWSLEIGCDLNDESEKTI